MKIAKLNQLNVFYEDILVGMLKRDSELVYSFNYSKEWLKHPNKFQLSLAMPFQEEEFGNRVTLSYFENLLPEEETRDSLEKKYHVKGTFDFLNIFGKDCEGAIIVTDKSMPPVAKKDSKEVKIDKKRIYQAIEHKRSVADAIAEIDPGYLSIGGVQTSCRPHKRMMKTTKSAKLTKRSISTIFEITSKCRKKFGSVRLMGVVAFGSRFYCKTYFQTKQCCHHKDQQLLPTTESL